MATEKVYRYKAWDIYKDTYLIHDSMATMAYIKARTPLQAIEESEKEVEASELDEEGKLKQR